jgi:hypothetical protein
MLLATQLDDEPSRPPTTSWKSKLVFYWRYVKEYFRNNKDFNPVTLKIHNETDRSEF